MRVVRAIQKENRDQHQRGHAEQRKHDCGMLQPFVVDLHANQHSDKAGSRPTELAEQEKISGVVALLGDDRRRAEHHHQSHKNQNQSDDKQPAVHTDALCHEEFISSRRHEAAGESCCGFFGEGLTKLVQQASRFGSSPIKRTVDA